MRGLGLNVVVKMMAAQLWAGVYWGQSDPLGQRCGQHAERERPGLSSHLPELPLGSTPRTRPSVVAWFDGMLECSEGCRCDIGVRVLAQGDPVHAPGFQAEL